MLVARLKGYLDGLPPKTRKRIVLAMLAAFAVLALYTFGKAFGFPLSGAALFSFLGSFFVCSI